MIKFGTDGWRDKINGDFNKDNISKLAQGFSNYLLQEKKKSKVLIGFDNRYKSKESSILIANVLVANEIEVYMIEDSCPTPVINFNMIKLDLDAAIIITASHNPYDYNGVKIRLKGGVIPNVDITGLIEKEVNTVTKVKLISRLQLYENVTLIEPYEDYIEHISKFVDFENFPYLSGKVIVDSMYGATNNLIPKLFDKIGIKVEHINNYQDYTFNYSQPEPVLPYIEETVNFIKENNYEIGLCFDGDGDRIGIVDDKGEYISGNDLFLILIYYLKKYHDQKGFIVKTISTSNKVVEVAKNLNFEILEVPVGFKYISEQFYHPEFVVGGEESGGFTIKNHIPDKDGLLISLLILDCMSREKRNISGILKEIRNYHQNWYFEKLDIHAERNEELVITKGLDHLLFDKHLICHKHRIENSIGEWVLLRKSGTENVLRVYIEGKDQLEVKKLKESIAEQIKKTR